MKKWEYTSLVSVISKVGVGELLGTLNLYGQQGWELCSQIKEYSAIHGDCIISVLKRQIETEDFEYE